MDSTPDTQFRKLEAISTTSEPASPAGGSASIDSQPSMTVIVPVPRTFPTGTYTVPATAADSVGTASRTARVGESSRLVAPQFRQNMADALEVAIASPDRGICRYSAHRNFNIRKCDGHSVLAQSGSDVAHPAPRISLKGRPRKSLEQSPEIGAIVSSRATQQLRDDRTADDNCASTEQFIKRPRAPRFSLPEIVHPYGRVGQHGHVRRSLRLSSSDRS